jgi:hypothetical protein
MCLPCTLFSHQWRTWNVSVQTSKLTFTTSIILILFLPFLARYWSELRTPRWKQTLSVLFEKYDLRV